MSRSAKRQKTNNGSSSSTTKEAFTTESLISNFQADEELAETFIPIIGKLYRKCNVVTTLFGASLNNASTTDILRKHQTQTDHRGRNVTVQETHKVLIAIARINGLKNLRCDLGQLLRVCEKTVESTALDFNGAVEDEVAKSSRSVPNLENQMNVAKDIVLYGFGRIGRLLARELIRKTGSGGKMRLRGIVVRPPKNGPDLEKRSQLLLRDSVHGQFNCKCELDHEKNAMIINGNYIQLIYGKSPDTIDYTKYGINNALVVDNTGIWRDRKGLGLHLKSKGASNVLLTAPAKDDIPNIVYGINEREFLSNKNETIFSAASCTTNAVVPTIKLIDDNFGGIISGHLETVHAFTNDQNLIDNMHKKNRRGRSAPLNLVLTETGAAKATIKCLPHLKGKLTANAIRVPTPDVSMAIMVLNLGRETTKEEINSFLRERATRGDLQQVLDFSDNKEAVSSDFVGNRAGCCVDGSSTSVIGSKVVLYCWYDNEFGYTCQVVRLMQALLNVSHPLCPLAKVTAPPPSIEDDQ